MAKKRYEIPSDAPQMASESAPEYNDIAVLPVPGQITVNIEDMRMQKEIKRAIGMIRGIISVDKSPAMKSYERARADVAAGRVVEFKDLDELKAYFDKQ